MLIVVIPIIIIKEGYFPIITIIATIKTVYLQITITKEVYSVVITIIATSKVIYLQTITITKATICFQIIKKIYLVRLVLVIKITTIVMDKITS